MKKTTTPTYIPIIGATHNPTMFGLVKTETTRLGDSEIQGSSEVKTPKYCKIAITETQITEKPRAKIIFLKIF